jgi:hypothetical protein
MKLKITISQLNQILKTEPTKFPIEVMMKNVDSNELMKIGSLLQNKK